LPASSASCGWMLYLLEQRYRLPFTAIRAGRLLGTDLRDYDVIVFPDGSDHGRYFDDGAVRRLKEWVAAGGVLIGIRGAAAFLARPEAELTTVRAVKDVRKARREEKPVDEGAPAPKPEPARPEEADRKST